MKKISVIVPAYNAENNIGKTLDALLDQTLEEIEIVVVNDGSKDNTLKVLKKYQKENPDKIVVIDQKNSGPGGARNAGIAAATGEYIGFLDSDDTNHKDMFKTMYEEAKKKNYDMVVCDTLMHYPNKTEIIPSGIEKELLKHSAVKEKMNFAYAVVWNKIVKASIIKEVKFSNKIWYEDVEFLFKLFTKINTIGVVKKAFCNYIQNENSITYTYNDKIFDIITVMDNILKYYKEENIFNDYYSELEYAYVRYLYGTFVRRMAKTKDKTKYKEAVNLAMKKVKENFPDYKKNKYLNMKGAKNIYLKNFNLVIAKIIYLVEKNKMNYELQNKIEKIVK